MCTGDNAHTGMAVAQKVQMLAQKDDPDITVIIGDVHNKELTITNQKTKEEVSIPDLLQMDKEKTELVLTASAFHALSESFAEPDDDPSKPLIDPNHRDLDTDLQGLEDVEPDAPIISLMPMVRVLARMKPNDKVQTVRLLQDRGLVVG